MVSPNRSLLELDKVGSSVSYINKEEIQKSSSTTTSGLLQEFGGFSISTKGNKGTDPSYFNRGLSRKYIKVFDLKYKRTHHKYDATLHHVHSFLLSMIRAEYHKISHDFLDVFPCVFFVS